MHFYNRSIRRRFCPTVRMEIWAWEAEQNDEPCESLLNVCDPLDFVPGEPLLRPVITTVAATGKLNADGQHRLREVMDLLATGTRGTATPRKGPAAE
jgi:hypothetical protein